MNEELIIYLSRAKYMVESFRSHHDPDILYGELRDLLSEAEDSLKDPQG